jgi:hypothetical protein
MTLQLHHPKAAHGYLVRAGPHTNSVTGEVRIADGSGEIMRCSIRSRRFFP